MYESGGGRHRLPPLPAPRRVAAHAGPPTPATAAFPTGVHVVLLADDDPPLRDLAAAYLRRAGFEVLPAGDASHTLEAYRAEHARIALLLVDEAMAGPDLVGELRRIDPAVRVALVVPEGREVLGAIKKPYRERELIEAVHAALSSR